MSCKKPISVFLRFSPGFRRTKLSSLLFRRVVNDAQNKRDCCRSVWEGGYFLVRLVSVWFQGKSVHVLWRKMLSGFSTAKGPFGRINETDFQISKYQTKSDWMNKSWSTQTYWNKILCKVNYNKEVTKIKNIICL